jgi:hypothetical protein
MPRRPVPEPPEELSGDWLAAQRREERLLARPARCGVLAAAVLACAVAALWLTGLLPAALTVAVLAGSAAAAAAGARAVRRGERRLLASIEAERQRLARLTAARQQRHEAVLDRQATAYRGWQQRRAAFRRQPQWHAVSLPAGVDRIDVAGGTLPGWAAMLTMVAAPRLSAGGEVTVLDLTEGAVARDLLAVARRTGIEPLVWVLPGDLPLLDLGTGLGAEALGDLLAQTAAAGDEPGGAAQPAADSAILDRVLDLLGDQPGLGRVTAALGFLAQASDPREALRSGPLTAAELDRLSGLFGRGAADRIVVERAWALQSRLGRLAALGSARVSLPPSRLRVAWLDRRCGALGSRVLGTYLAVALTHLLRQEPARLPGDAAAWQHTLCLLGADKLRADVLDRLEDACEISGTGLVAAYRSIPPHVASRLGRGNAAVAFMRLGNAQDARLASEQIGTEHRFVLSQLTDTVGTSVTDSVGDSYSSTVGSADSIADSAGTSVTAGSSRGRGRSRQDWAGPFGGLGGSASRDASRSAGTSDSRSVTEGISSGTSWGISTSRAVGTSSSAGRTLQRSREFLVEQRELQRLPASAMLVSYPAADGRQVVLADANPAIVTLPTATLRSLDETRAGSPRPRGSAAGGDRRVDGGE